MKPSPTATISPTKKLKLWLLVYCVAALTVFQFIPFYFSQQMPRLIYYAFVYVVFAVSSVTELQRYLQRTTQYLFTKIVMPIFLFIGLLIALLFIVGSFFAVWAEAGIYYTNKSNPDVRIISRYLNLGAGGGGTEPGDYEIVLHRPITPYFKMETSIDTNKINKKDWVKVKN